MCDLPLALNDSGLSCHVSLPSLPEALRGTSFAKQWHPLPGMEWPHSTVQAGCQLGRSSSAGILCSTEDKPSRCTALGNASQQTESNYFLLFGIELECCHQFWVLQCQKDDDKLEKGMWRATDMAGGTTIWGAWDEHLFSLSLSRLRRYPIATFTYLTDNWKRWYRTFLRGAWLQQMKA